MNGRHMKRAFKLPICAVGAAAFELGRSDGGYRWISATESQAATATVAAVPASGDETLSPPSSRSCVIPLHELSFRKVTSRGREMTAISTP